MTSRTLLLRSLTGVFGAYVATWGLIALIIVLGVGWLGLKYEDASNLAMMLGFPAYAVMFLMIFFVRRLWLAAIALFGGGVAMALLASCLQSIVISGALV